MRRFAICTLLVLAMGCGGDSKAQIVPFDQVPEALLERAKKELPNVKFDSAVRRSDGGLEIRGKDPNGNVRDVEFSAAGELTEVE